MAAISRCNPDFEQTLACAPVCPAAPPPWLVDEFSRDDGSIQRSEWISELGFEFEAFRSQSLLRCSCRVRDARHLSACEFRTATAAAYRALLLIAGRSPAPHLVRVWNFLPQIHETLDTGLSRYFEFNRARHDALAEAMGVEAFAAMLPTATGVGHSGRDLFIHALFATAPGMSIENPRQRPAYEYSERYGPRPPCFARATAVRLPLRPRHAILVGGTASIVGEQSMHHENLHGQLMEAIENLRALVDAARRQLGADMSHDSLADISLARVHVARPEDEAVARRVVLPTLSSRCATEFVQADLCRSELLVEIECVAFIDAPTA